MREEVTPELDEEITLNEVKESIRKLKNGKAPGPDDVVAEVLKHGGDQVELAVWDLCQRTWRDEKPPEAWTYELQRYHAPSGVNQRESSLKSNAGLDREGDAQINYLP